MNKPKRLIVLFVPLFAFIFIYGAMFYCPPDIAKSATIEVTVCDPKEIPSLTEIQAIIGVKPDGKYGPKTKEAWERYLCDQYARKEFEK